MSPSVSVGRIPAAPLKVPIRPAWIAAAVAIAAGAAAGALAAKGAGLIRLDVALSPEFVVAALAGIVVLIALSRRPVAVLMLVLAIAYGNVSEVLVREHGFPSVLQLLVPLLLVVLLASPDRSEPIQATGLRPDRAFLLATVAWLGVILLGSTWAWEPRRVDDALEASLKAAILAIVAGWAIPRLSVLVAAAWTLLVTGAILSAASSFQVLTGRWEQSLGGFARVKQAHIAGVDLGQRATGPLADPNFYAQALIPLVPIAIALALGAGSRAGRAAAAGLGAVVACGIVTTYSRGGALAMFLVVAAFAWSERRHVRRRHVVAVLALAVVAATAMPSNFFTRRLETLAVLMPVGNQPIERHDSSVAKRRVLMEAAASMAVENPLLGVGAGNYGTHFEEHAGQVGAQARIYHDPGERAFAHSLPLEVAAETGLLGLLAFGGVVASALVAAARARTRFADAGNPMGARLALALLLGILGTMASSLLLHGDYPRYAWLTFGLGVAAWRCSARSPAPAPSAAASA